LKRFESLLITPAIILGTLTEAGLYQKNSTSLTLGTQTAFDFCPPQEFGGQAPCLSRRLYPPASAGLIGARKNFSNLVSNFESYLQDTILSIPHQYHLYLFLEHNTGDNLSQRLNQLTGENQSC
jgi:hypothetical protein